MTDTRVIADISEVLLELGLSASCSEEDRAIAQTCLMRATGEICRFLDYDPVQKSHTEFYPRMDMRKYGSGEYVWEVSDTIAYTRSIAGAATSELQLKHLPLRSITSLHIDYDGRAGTRVGAFGSESLKTEGSDFWANYDEQTSDGGTKICRDGILRSEGLWPDLAGSVKLTYVAGYSNSELHGTDALVDASPILECVIEEAVNKFLKVKAKGKKRLSGWAGPLASENLGDYSYSSMVSVMEKIIGSMGPLSASSTYRLMQFQRMDLGVI